ncbi:MAG TPA: group II truncated hemoglobin [Burkholderiaceae bacterium]
MTTPPDAASGDATDPRDAPSPTSLFEQLGGEPGVRALVDRFYDLMELEPEFADLRGLHPTTTEGSRDKLFWFLCGWLGGPDHYIERFGHPRLRMRHFPYAIGVSQRDQWITCMGLAMAEIGEAGGFTPAIQQRLLQAFAQTANHMRNTPF